MIRDKEKRLKLIDSLRIINRTERYTRSLNIGGRRILLTEGEVVKLLNVLQNETGKIEPP